MWVKRELHEYENDRVEEQKEGEEEEMDNESDDANENSSSSSSDDEEYETSLQPTSIFEYEQPTYTRLSPVITPSSNNTSVTAASQSSMNYLSQNAKKILNFNENQMQKALTNESETLVKKKRGRKPKSLQNENFINSNSQFQVNENGNLKVNLFKINFASISHRCI